jgi:hypothetical protein
MDARTRERLPVLPILIRSAAQQHADARALLQAARDTRPGDAITAPGTALIRPAAASITVNVWAGDPATGNAATSPQKKTAHSGASPAPRTNSPRSTGAPAHPPQSDSECPPSAAPAP